MRPAAVLGVLLLLGTTSLRADEGLDAFVKKVKAAMAGVKTTRGRFVQTKRLAVFDDAVLSSGTFAIRRPDHLRWEVTTPFRSILVIAGERGARWNETRKDVERFLLAEKPGIDIAVKQMFTWYSGGFDEVTAQFDASLEADGRTVALVPRNEKVREVTSRITIRLAPSLQTIEQIVLEEKGGDRTEIAFTDVETNAVLADATFEVKQP